MCGAPGIHHRHRWLTFIVCSFIYVPIGVIVLPTPAAYVQPLDLLTQAVCLHRERRGGEKIGDRNVPKALTQCACDASGFQYSFSLRKKMDTFTLPVPWRAPGYIFMQR